MNLCHKCIQKIGMRIAYPHLLSNKYACDECKQARYSFNIEDVAKQMLVEESKK